MAQDRGGLSYRITVKDEFSKNTSKFREEIAASKAAFANFRSELAAQGASQGGFKVIVQGARSVRKELSEQEKQLKALAAESKRQREVERESVRIRNTQQRDATRATRERLAAERLAARQRIALLREEQRAAEENLRAQRSRLRALATQQREQERTAKRISDARRRDEAQDLARRQADLKAFADEQKRREREASKLSAAATQDVERRRKQDPRVIAERENERLLKRQAVALERIKQLRASGREELITRQLKTQAGLLDASARSANSLLFTFRRLVGVFAIFALIRNAIQGFQDLVREGIAFNDKVDQATISIAGLVSAVAEVRDEFGNTLDVSERFVASQTIARRQIRALRQDALRTTATFQELLDTFQIAVAPGFAAGLNLDEIRRLSVSISQAAQAIGVPQNQLAEEIRSLLSGTIQARTTRIATALQITNADIRRLRETGELFDFLEERFEALGVAAELSARKTLTGIRALVSGAVEELLGEAARPLFDELVALGNEVFDEFLTIKDAAGNIRPNPQALAAFQSLFNALRDGVRDAAALGRELGFEGLRDVLETVGASIRVIFGFLLGFGEVFARTFGAVLAILRQIGKILTVEVGDGLLEASKLAGAATAAFIIMRSTLRLMGLDVKTIGVGLRAMRDAAVAAGTALRTGMLTPLTAIGGLLAGGGAILLGFNKIAEAIFGVNLDLEDTISLLTTGLVDAADQAANTFKKFGVRLQAQLQGLFASPEQQAALERASAALQAALDKEADARAARREKKIADRIAAAARREIESAPGFDPNFDANAKDAAEAIEGFEGIISTARTAITGIQGDLGELSDEMFKVGEEFRRVGQFAGIEGSGGQIARLFAQEQVESAIRLRRGTEDLVALQQSISAAVEKQGISEERIADIRRAASAAPEERERLARALNLSEVESQILSLMLDERLLQSAITDAARQANALAQTKAAILARETVPALQKEARELGVQLDAERAINDALEKRVGQRRLAVIEAENELKAALAARKEVEKALRRQIAQVEPLSRPVTGIENDPNRVQIEKERAANLALLEELRARLEIEGALTAEIERRLQRAREEAALAESGTLAQGTRAGFEQLANDLPTIFEAAKNIVNGIVNDFVSAAGQAFRSIFDPRVQADLLTQLGEFLLSAAQLIFQQALSSIIQSLISSALTAQATEITSATTAATIRSTEAATRAALEIQSATVAASIRAAGGGVGAVKGGLVSAAEGGLIPKINVEAVHSLVARKAKGYARGGRPKGLDPRDTVPAFLQPGEFVIRKAVVDSLGAGFFQNVNAGNFKGPVAPAISPGTGGAVGGLVADRPVAGTSRSDRDGGVQVLPTLVAGEREMDRLVAGGKSPLLRFLHDNGFRPSGR